MTDKSDDMVPTAEQVLQFLAENPNFLEQFSKKESVRNNPADNKIVDLTPAIAQRARNEARRIGQQNKSILNLAAKNMVNWRRLHHAAMALLAAGNIDQLLHVIATQFPPIFDLESCHLITASQQFHQKKCADPPLFCPNDILTSLTGTKSFVLGAPEASLCDLLGKTPASVAIITLPDRLTDQVAKTLLVLCGQKQSSFTPDLSSDLLVLLAELVGVALAARLEVNSGVYSQ